MPEDSRIAGLDGLRGIAALAVFGVHFNQIVGLDTTYGPVDLYRWFGNGEYGVALFFGLSGFLLGLPFWRAKLEGHKFPSVRRYALRRVARILPAYYLCLLVLVLWSGIWRVPGTTADILLHITFLFNYAEFSILSINPPFWTLAVEMQFYLLLPLVFLGIWRLNLRRSMLALIVLAAASYGLHYGLMVSVTRVIDWPLSSWQTWVRPYGAVLNHSLPGHLPHFLFGVLAGPIFIRLKNSGGAVVGAWRFAESLFWLVALMILLLLATEVGGAIQIPFGRYGLPLVPLLITMVIVATPFTRIARAMLEAPPLRQLGSLSYGVYIYHLPCLTALDQYLRGQGMDAAEYPLAFGGGAFVITVVAATVSYLLIERPVLARVHRIRRRRFAEA